MRSNHSKRAGILALVAPLSPWTHAVLLPLRRTMWFGAFKPFSPGFRVARSPKLPNENGSFPAQAWKVSFLLKDLRSLLPLEKVQGRQADHQ